MGDPDADRQRPGEGDLVTMVEQPTRLVWEPPGPGTWLCDRDHKRTSQTVALQGYFPRAMEAGFRAGTARYGLPVSHLAIRYVNGYAYAQMQLAGVPAKAAASGPPPRPILFVLVRLLPELRRRAKAAEETLATRRWRGDADEWFKAGRAARIAANLALQDEELDGLDDRAVADHLERVTANAEAGLAEHFAHVPMQLPVGDLLSATTAWGIPAQDVA